MEHYKTSSEKETIGIAATFGATLKPHDMVLFKGEMGAGKTYFTKGIALALGITDEITSPTFALVNEYKGHMELFHFDLFRISGFEELYDIGFFDYLIPEAVIVIEWGENVPDFLEKFISPDYTIYTVEINKLSLTDREITISSHNSK